MLYAPPSLTPEAKHGLNMHFAPIQGIKSVNTRLSKLGAANLAGLRCGELGIHQPFIIQYYNG